MGASVCCKEKWHPIVDNDDLCDPARPSSRLELRVRCSDGQHLRIEANHGWTVHDVMIAIMQRTGVHRLCQRLTFAGRRLEPFPTRRLHNLRELVDGATFFVTILRDRFPEQLGPFGVAVVPIKGQEFSLVEPGSGTLTRQGAAWTLKREALKSAGVNSRRPEPTLLGHLSPAHKLTLPEEERQEAQVPVQAQEFSWSYPVSGWESLEGGERSSAAESFFQGGGFVYLDKRRRVVRATALVPSKTDLGGLQFCRPKKWEPQWTAALLRDGRFHEVASKSLSETGAQYFCWLKPGELLLATDGRPLQSQPEVPNGGFAFLFLGADSRPQAAGRTVQVREVRKGKSGRASMLLLRREVDVQMDRYFPIASGGEYRRRPMLKSEGLKLSFLPWRRGRETTPPPTKSVNTSNQSKTLNGRTWPQVLSGSASGTLGERVPPKSAVVRRVLSDQAITPEVAPDHWKPACSGLVEVVDTELKAKFQLLLAHAHKPADNWTRDRGCKLHGVNGCDLTCAYEHMVAVPTGYTIVRVWRNQNLDLWAKYCAMRAAIGEECTNDGSPLERVPVQTNGSAFDQLEGPELQTRRNEWRLFHGACSEACHRICEGNFDIGHAGMGATWKEDGDAWGLPLYGFGFYFAEHITKADEYAVEDVEGNFSVLLCRVAGGRTNLVTEPSIDPGELEGQVLDGPYHSVFGDRVSVQKKPFREVMVYDRSQIYPEFLLTYRRRYAKAS